MGCGQAFGALGKARSLLGAAEGISCSQRALWLSKGSSLTAMVGAVTALRKAAVYAHQAGALDEKVLREWTCQW